MPRLAPRSQLSSAPARPVPQFCFRCCCSKTADRARSAPDSSPSFSKLVLTVKGSTAAPMRNPPGSRLCLRDRQAELAAEERFGFLQHLHLRGLVAEPVAFILKELHLHRDAVAPQGGGHPFGLLGGHDVVLKSLEEQHRAADPIGVLQERSRVVELPLCGPSSHQPIEITGFEAVGVDGHDQNSTKVSMKKVW